MTAAGGWLLVPAVLTVVLLGWGLLADALTGRTLPAALLPGVGLSALICVAGLVVLVDGAGPALVPVALAGTVAGLVIAAPHRLRGADLHAWAAPLGAAAAVLLLQALPTLLDGGVIGGFGRLDDSATWLGLTDRVIEHGRDVTGLPPGTYTRVLQDYLGQGYPVGGLLPVGIAAKLSLQDVANAYQPVIAMYAVVLACSLYAAVRGLVDHRGAAALAALAGAQSSLLYGYAQWGGVKELAAAAVLATAAPLVARCARADGARPVALTLVVAGALGGVLGVAGGPWILPVVALALGTWLWHARAAALRPLVVLLPVGLVAALPPLSMADILVRTTPTTFGANEITEAEGLGRLLAPLDVLQGAGLWPQEDFRAASDVPALLTLLALTVVGLAVAGVVLAVRRRALALPVLLVTGLVGTGAIVALGSPWIDAKALAITSPFVLAAAAALLARGAADEGRRLAAAGAVGLACAVAVSTTAVARSTPAAPRVELTELRDIGERYAGEGPTLVLAHQVYATRHFLRDLDVEGASERRDRFVRLVDGSLAPDYTEVDVSRIAPTDLAVYRLVVRRRGAPGAMPPGYERRFTGRVFEVWRREGALGPTP